MPHQQPNSTDKVPVLQGRVFERLRRFADLPADLQQDTKQFQEHIEQRKSTLFENHYHALVTSVYSVRCEALVKAIAQWLQARVVTQSGQVAQMTSSADAPKVEASISTVPVTPGAGGSAHESSELLVRAKAIAQALVLSGVLTPCNGNAETDATASDYCLSDSDLLIPVAKTVAELHTTSVWSIVDGATYARLLKRKAGIFTNSKDVYVVMSEKSKKVYLFTSDVAREPIAEINGECVTVLADTNRFEFGVRVATNSADAEDKPELFDVGTKHAQGEFVSAWLAIGAKYLENIVDEVAEANARGLVGPEASHNAKRNLSTPAPLEISTANIAAAQLSGIAPTKISDTPGTTSDDDDDGKNAAVGRGAPVAANTPPVDPRLFPSVADSGLGALRLPLGRVIDTIWGSFIDTLPVDKRVIKALQFVVKPYYLYDERRRRGPDMTECTYLE